MTTGGEWAIKAAVTTLCNILGLEPEKVKADLAKMMQIVVGTGEQLIRIEAQQLQIMRALNIQAENEFSQENSNGQSEHSLRAIGTGNGSAEAVEFRTAPEIGE